MNWVTSQNDNAIIYYRIKVIIKVLTYNKEARDFHVANY